MSARRTDMHRLQELIRLHRLGQGQRAIARQLGMGRDTIRYYKELLARDGLLDGDPTDLPDAASLQALLVEIEPAPLPVPQTLSSVHPWAERIAALHAKGCGPTAIHDHLRLHHDDYEGHLSSVKRMCLRLTRAAGPKESDVVIRVETTPGEIAQVDFGYAGMRFDPVQRVLRRCWVFVMTLGFSRDIFCASAGLTRLEGASPGRAGHRSSGASSAASIAARSDGWRAYPRGQGDLPTMAYRSGASGSSGSSGTRTTTDRSRVHQRPSSANALDNVGGDEPEAAGAELIDAKAAGFLAMGAAGREESGGLVGKLSFVFSVGPGCHRS